jgi:hypothetical protein
MFNIKRTGFIGIRLIFYKHFYNLNKIRKLSCLIINKVYK